MMITLKTLPKASIQRVFNQVANHLLKQGRKASKNGLCQYLTKDGSKCGIGSLIGKREYKPIWEGQGWQGPLNFGRDCNIPYSFFEEIQTLHDDTNARSWRKGLKSITDRFGLSTRWMKEKR